MDVNLTERDQIELLKSWWNKYGLIGIITIALSIGGNYAWNYYQSSHAEYAQNASVIYEQMNANLAKNNMTEFKTQGTYIVEHYKKAPYATLASFALSTQAIKEGKFDEAKKYLQFVIDNNKDKSLREIARLRQARVLLSEKAYNEALTIISKVDDKTFIPLIEEVRGDIYSSQGDSKKAKVAYKTALDALSTGSNPILRMKYDQSV